MKKIVFPLKPKMRNEDVANLHDGLLLLLEKNRALLRLIPLPANASEPIDWPNVIKLLQKEREEKHYGKMTVWLIDKIQKVDNLELSGIVDEPTASKLNFRLEKLGAFDQTSSTERQITGKVVIEHGMPANQLKLRLYQRDFGKKTTLLVETQTLADGTYTFIYKSTEKSLSLEVRAVSNSNEELLLTKPLNNLKANAILNLTAPASLQPLADEYSRLSTDLLPHIGQMSTLANAQENTEQQDLTVLNRATGWDARLIALAATSEQLAADPKVALPQQALYGLLRVGLPSDKLLLAQVEAEVVEQALIKSRDAGIVELSDAEIGSFKQSFSTFSHGMRLNTPAPGSQSTYGQLLETSGLPQNVKNDFISVYLNHKGTSTQLWEAAKNSGLTDDHINMLKLQGKFAYLAGNSEAMTDRLIKKQISDPVQLVEQNLYQADTWMTEVFEQAGIPESRRNSLTDADKKNLDEVIPAAYQGEKVEDRIQAYTEDMARKVRQSYPTQVVGQLMETDEAFKLPSAHNATVNLLKNAEKKGFRLGETPVANFLKSNTDVTAGIALVDLETAQQQLQMMQRLYQITPGNEAMPILIKMDMTSAYDVTANSESQFIFQFNDEYFNHYNRPPILGMAELIFRKARQVNSVTYNLLFTIASKMDSEPEFAGISAPIDVREEVKKNLIKHFPTMESLFGSMDFCECEHCRSVLSPTL